jgi:hypothetical protein
VKGAISYIEDGTDNVRHCFDTASGLAVGLNLLTALPEAFGQFL